MKARVTPSAIEFLEIAGDVLLVDEIRHSLSFGIAERISKDTHLYGAGDPWFITIEDAGKIRATAIRTPPHKVILSHITGDVGKISMEFARSIHALDPVIPGVIGDREIVEPFIQHWCASFGYEVIDVMGQCIYQLIELVEPIYAGGYLRLAGVDDEEIVISWAAEFHEETVGDVLPRSHFQRYHERILNGDIYLWDNAGPVSMAAKSRPTRRGISVGAVYTPPKHRNSGYATSCVAALCKILLHDYDFCVLYTDLSNPISNSIYQKIGFNEYSDSLMITLKTGSNND